MTGHKVIVAEQPTDQQSAWKAFWLYHHSMPLQFLLMWYLGMLVTTICQGVGLVQIAKWTDSAEVAHFAAWNSTVGREYTFTGFYIYAACGLMEVLSLAVGILAASYGGVAVSQNLHQPLVHNLLRSSMAFFDSTPVGRILNRIGKDMEAIDLAASYHLRILYFAAFVLARSLLLLLWTTPWYFVVLIPASVLYGWFMKRYFATGQQLKRLVAASRSPIYSLFGEIVEGATMIRCFDRTALINVQAHERIDQHYQSYYSNMVIGWWIRTRCDFIASVMIGVCGIFAVLLRHQEGFGSGIVAMNIFISCGFLIILTFVMQIVTELEENMVAVERVAEYSQHLAIEERLNTATTVVPEDWPKEGRIRFENLSVRYSEGLEMVLRNLNFEINTREKIGIIGRTGTGKSTIALALFRMIEASDGRILIDGVDISTLPLQKLRSSLAIIPQDVLLLCGTLRMNLDPFNQYSEDEIWLSLEQAHLKQFVQSLEMKLEHEISESGGNLSLGQRQLLCLARALLRRNRILVLDEPTAAVDVETDELIQKTIRTAFKDCTIITIAHRINTILDYDRLLVLEHGQVREFDTPAKLLADSDSAFYSIYQEMNGGKHKHDQKIDSATDE